MKILTTTISYVLYFTFIVKAAITIQESEQEKECSSNLKPAAIKLYSNCNYKNLVAELPIGSYTQEQLLDRIEFNDVRSIKIETGYSFIFFKENNLDSKTGTAFYKQNLPCLKEIIQSETVKSLLVSYYGNGSKQLPNPKPKPEGESDGTVETKPKPEFEVQPVPPSQSPIEFGAMLSDSAIQVGSGLKTEDLIKALENIVAIRISVGPSDYSLTNYAWDSDSLENDAFHNDVKLPFLKKVLKLRPDLEIYGAPWSPMHTMCSGNNNSPCLFDTFEPDWYASMLVAYYKKYKRENIILNYISLQNEPLHYGSNNYPNFGLFKEEAGQLREQLYKLEPELKVSQFDHNPDKTGIEYVNYLANQNKLYPGDVVAWHLYAGSLKDIPTYNNNKCVVTEITSSDGDDKQGSYNWHKDRVCEAVAKQCGTYFYFNLFLDTNAGPNIRQDDYKAIPMYTVNTDTNEIESTWSIVDLFRDFREGKLT
eukprot:Pgem_evm1s17626